jgi:hypothetical protein
MGETRDFRPNSKGIIDGDGVHVASGLAAMAGPGEVCISEAVYEQIKHKLYYDYELLGERKMANSRRREIIWIFLLCLTLLGITGGIWYMFEQPHRRVTGAEPPTRVQMVQGEQQTSRRNAYDNHAYSIVPRPQNVS